MSDDKKAPIIERYCTKDNPWDHTPFDPTKETVIHDDAKELYPDYDGCLVTYECPNCGHVYTIDYGD